MRRVDAHHHLWDPARRAYPWMDERLAPIRRRFGPEDLDAATEPHVIGQTVVVQTVASVEETKNQRRRKARKNALSGPGL